VLSLPSGTAGSDRRVSKAIRHATLKVIIRGSMAFTMRSCVWKKWGWPKPALKFPVYQCSEPCD
jgi:hypothetical protein